MCSHNEKCAIYKSCKMFENTQCHCENIDCYWRGDVADLTLLLFVHRNTLFHTFFHLYF